MSESRLSDMSEAEFDAMIEGHLERMARGDREREADVVVDLLLPRREAPARVGRPIRRTRGRVPDRTRSQRHVRRFR